MNDDNDNKLAVRTPIRAGKSGVELNSFDEMWRFSQMVIASGMAPKGFDRPESDMFALQMSMELGISPIQGLQNIAVINGRVGVFGDLALALVRGSGLCESYSQELVGEGDNRRAVVKSTRGGIEIISEFSVADAKKASLWGKQGPWSQYPDRMLTFRARSWNLRDNFGDVLKGFRTSEELADQEPEKPAKAVEIKRPELPPVRGFNTGAIVYQPPTSAGSGNAIPGLRDHQVVSVPPPSTVTVDVNADRKRFQREQEDAVDRENKRRADAELNTAAAKGKAAIADQKPTYDPAILNQVKAKLAETVFTAQDLLAVLRKNSLSTKEQLLDEVPPDNLQILLDNWPAALGELQEAVV